MLLECKLRTGTNRILVGSNSLWLHTVGDFIPVPIYIPRWPLNSPLDQQTLPEVKGDVCFCSCFLRYTTMKKPSRRIRSKGKRAWCNCLFGHTLGGKRVPWFQTLFFLSSCSFLHQAWIRKQSHKWQHVSLLSTLAKNDFPSFLFKAGVCILFTPFSGTQQLHTPFSSLFVCHGSFTNKNASLFFFLISFCKKYRVTSCCC